jgi:dTDP-4-amino-4,6-dideoxygalactose transaminase
MSEITIPFNKPYMTGKELLYIEQAHHHGKLAGDGPFTKKCQLWIEQGIGANKALLTHSCTAGLEMAALLLDIQEGDEVIMPSYTFVSTANAFVLRGATPVFVDIRPDTLNLNENLIEQAITSRTKAIIPVHYAGVACEMDSILELAQDRKIAVVEDAAQALMSTYKGRPLGGLGHLAAFSFHETKNIISGEGGALVVNDPEFIALAEIIREKGTDRSRFFRGMVDKYTWQEKGSSFLPGELTAAFLWAQLEAANSITKKRLDIWMRYHSALEDLENLELIRRPIVPNECTHNGHMYYILLNPSVSRQALIEEFKRNGIMTPFHYVPLHSSPAGIKFGRVDSGMQQTNDLSSRLLRLPLYFSLTEMEQDRVIDVLFSLRK